MRTFFEAKSLKTSDEEKPKSETEVQATEVKKEVIEDKSELPEETSEAIEEAKITRAAETGEITEVEKNIEASTEEVEPETKLEDINESEENTEGAEDLPEDELITATSSDEEMANQSIMSATKGQGSTDHGAKCLNLGPHCLLEVPATRPWFENPITGDAFAEFVNRHAKGPLFGEQIGKSALDLDPNAAKFDAIERFDSTSGNFQLNLTAVIQRIFLGVNAWENSVNVPNKTVPVEFEAVKKFDSSISQDNYRNGLTVVHP